MSQAKIRQALEVALSAITPSLATAWENVAFTPPASSVPYQQAHMLFAQPDNTVFGSEHTELGYMQVKLMYPTKTGSAAAIARAELIRTTFARGNSFASGGVTAVISHTPEIMPASPEDGRYAVTVKIRFFANIN